MFEKPLLGILRGHLPLSIVKVLFQMFDPFLTEILISLRGIYIEKSISSNHVNSL